MQVAGNPNTPGDALVQLAQDDDIATLTNVAKHPNTPKNARDLALEKEAKILSSYTLT